MHIGATREFPTLIRRGSSTYGLVLPPSQPLLGLTLTFGLSPTNSTGMTRQCFLSNTTGKKHKQRISHINSSGIK